MSALHKNLKGLVMQFIDLSAQQAETFKYSSNFNFVASPVRAWGILILNPFSRIKTKPTKKLLRAFAVQ